MLGQHWPEATRFVRQIEDQVGFVSLAQCTTDKPRLAPAVQTLAQADQDPVRTGRGARVIGRAHEFRLGGAGSIHTQRSTLKMTGYANRQAITPR
ncbi:hypothetical protein D3C86_1902460 [compost metagenome]